jgi:hypothetical protein
MRLRRRASQVPLLWRLHAAYLQVRQRAKV